MGTAPDRNPFTRARVKIGGRSAISRPLAREGWRRGAPVGPRLVSPEIPKSLLAQFRVARRVLD